MLNINHPEFLPIHKCEDLFEGMEDRLQKLCEALLWNSRVQSAKGVWQRNSLNRVAYDFESCQSKDEVKTPHQSIDPKCMKLAPEVKVTFVGNEE